MKKLTVVEEKGYKGLPGMAFPLPEGVINDKDRKHPMTGFAWFPGPRYTFFTEYKEIQDAIESSEAWRKGDIVKQLTHAELERDRRNKKITQMIEDKKAEIEAVGVAVLPNEATDYEAIKKYASNFDVKVTGVSKVKILEDLYGLFGVEFKPQPKERTQQKGK